MAVPNTQNHPEKYNRIGRAYNFTRCADPYLVSQLKRLLQPQKEFCYLDLGCGTGHYTAALAEEGGVFYGMDPSGLMVRQAKADHPGITWKTGQAESIPFPESYFGGITCIMTVHHWTDMERGFRECARVLRKGGRLVLFGSCSEQMEHYWLKQYFPEMMDKASAQMPSLKALEGSLEAAGFTHIHTEPYRIREDLRDKFLYSGKHHPEWYLNAGFRRGISAFRTLITETELQQGIEKLESDLHSGNFGYADTESGDYLFMQAIKGA